MAVWTARKLRWTCHEAKATSERQPATEPTASAIGGRSFVRLGVAPRSGACSILSLRRLGWRAGAWPNGRRAGSTHAAGGCESAGR
jgi:hypothetical protein